MSFSLIDRTNPPMSRRARVYISAGGWRHFLIGATIIAFPWMYSSAAFIPIFNLINQQIWAYIMLAVGIVCLAGATTRNPDIARAGMVGSAVVTAVLAVGLSMGIANVWIGFAEAVGNHDLLNLIHARPRMFPIEYLAAKLVAPPSPFLPLLMLSVTVKDFTMCAQPLRVPLEDRTGTQGRTRRET